jgi:thiamine biosynthesis lipoprotein
MAALAYEQADATEPGSVASAGFRAIGTTNEILVTRPDVLARAVEVASDYLRELDATCSRFRPDSELSKFAAQAAAADTTWYASPLLLDYLHAALYAAELTDGLVDFTVGSALISTGYDQDVDAVRARSDFHATSAEVPGWQWVSFGSLGRVSVPQGTVIDLGASAKAHAADQIARLLALHLPGGFLVNLGGDIATSGDVPAEGWSVGVEAADGTERQAVAITTQAITTSSTQLRTWQTDAGPAHHIIDPRTGDTAAAVWAQVSCVAATALEANTASTAALVLGEDAVAWLDARGVPARLERLDGTAVFTCGWPQPDNDQEKK